MIAVIKNFQEVIETKDIGRMTKELYEFLNLYCGFIAHYDINGFKATYKSPRILPGSSSGTLTENTLTTTGSTPAMKPHTRTPE